MFENPEFFALVVEDDAIILMDLRDMVEEVGFTVIDAMSGDRAWQLLADNTQTLTLLITDVDLPGNTNGFQLAKHVTATCPWVEILMISGRREPYPGEMPAKAAFLGKPFSHAMMHEELRNLLPKGKLPNALSRIAGGEPGADPNDEGRKSE